MNHRAASFSRTLLGLLTVATALSPLACIATVIDERRQPPASSSGDIIDPPPSSPSIAMLLSQFPPIGGGSGSGSGGDPGIDPNTLYVMIGSYDRVCADPFAASACPSWQVTIGIPPALQQPGVISLSAPGVISTFSATGPNQGANDCWFGGGSFIDGTIEITSIDANAVSFTLAGTTTSDAPADGQYVAARCP